MPSISKLPSVTNTNFHFFLEKNLNHSLFWQSIKHTWEYLPPCISLFYWISHCYYWPNFKITHKKQPRPLSDTGISIERHWHQYWAVCTGYCSVTSIRSLILTFECKQIFLSMGLMQERHNSSVLAMELRLSCTNLSLSWSEIFSQNTHIRFLFLKATMTIGFCKVLCFSEINNCLNHQQ